MVTVKVRETYDLHTKKNKMTVIGIHTPRPDIIKRNYPGLLMQCRAYRPKQASVRLACASVLPLDPLGVGLTSNDVAPEDVFNPILYKPLSNFGMSQLENRINMLEYANPTAPADIIGETLDVDTDSFTDQADEFNLYYGLLSETHTWRHAHPQNGLTMAGLRPIVYETLTNVADQPDSGKLLANPGFAGILDNGSKVSAPGVVQTIRGRGKPMPFINCTSPSYTSDGVTASGYTNPGFSSMPAQCQLDVPFLLAYVGVIIVPPCRLHELFFRLVVEWEIEFSMIRPLSDITNFGGVAQVGNAQHYQNYSYSSTKEAITGTDDSDSILDTDSCMVASNVDVEKVM